MKKDMTYNAIDYEKANVGDFVKKIAEIPQGEKREFAEADRSFFATVAKHIIFLKYLYFSYTDEKESRYLRTIISDLYFLLLSVIKSEQRYAYLNIRSIIENNIRWITGVSFEETFITKEVFEEIKDKITKDEFSLLRSEYRVACNYVHGGDLLKDDLSFVLDECFEKKQIPDREKNAFYIRECSILKIFDKMTVMQYPELVNGCFHRRKTLMEYLIGKDKVDLLFEQL